MAKVLASATTPALLKTVERFTGTGTPTVVVDVTISVTVAGWTRAPDVPVTVIEYVPVGVVEAVEIVKAEDPEEVMEAGEKIALAPAGRPAADRLTIPAKPFWGVTVVVTTPLVPAINVLEVGVTASPKLGAGLLTVGLL